MIEDIASFDSDFYYGLLLFVLLLFVLLLEYMLCRDCLVIVGR